MNLVDRVRGRGYKGALFAAATLSMLLVSPVRAETTTVKGAILPAGARPVGENRYRSPSSYADTLTFYSKQYKSNPRKTIVNQPGIRAVHIVNDGRGEWEGLNIYELDGETRIFVVVRDQPSKK